MDNLGMTRLGVAALSGDAERVKELLAKDDAFERDAFGNTVAHYAAVAGDQAFTFNVSELLSGHIEVMDIPNKNKQLPKHILGGAKLIRTDPYECACEKCPSVRFPTFWTSAQ
jgi:ankyrin repeat protein